MVFIPVWCGWTQTGLVAAGFSDSDSALDLVQLPYGVDGKGMEYSGIFYDDTARYHNDTLRL
jgi:hypothetical protein